MNENLALADRFFRAIEAGDIAAVESIYAPDASIWHNNDRKSQSVAENLRTLAFVVRTLKERRYEVTSRSATADGFVQEHVLSGTLPDGTKFSLPAAIFVTVKDGRIAHLREYLDGADANGAFAPFLSARA